MNMKKKKAREAVHQKTEGKNISKQYLTWKT